MCELIIKHLNSIGLILDLIGVILLWKFGIPNNQLAPKDMEVTVWVDAVREVNKDKHNRARLTRLFMDNLAYIFLFLGFLAQLLSNHVKT